MKYIKSYILFVLLVFALTGCNKYDDLQDDVNDLKDRVTLIEQQVKLLNDNLAVVSYILDTQNKAISKVEKSTDGAQHIITLSNGDKLTLTIGKPGTIEEPVITVGDDKMWYINGVSTGVIAVGEDGKNGEGFPEFRVEKGNWQVRFGTGAWTNVSGGEGITNGSSLGDQFFESATVSEDGKNLIVTLKDGTIQTLPIMESLTCMIDKSELTLDAENFLVIEKGERIVIPVKIVGEKTQVTYPQDWRATLTKMDAADAKGNNYTLYIYAPAAATKSLTRAAADNTSDVTIQVQKGTFWAVDKIKVKNPKDYSNNINKYEDDLDVTVGGLKINRNVYGTATEITADKTLDKGGVYFVSTNNVTLTYDLGTIGVDNLIIIPTTSDVTTINLNVSKQIFFTGTFACQNVILENKVSNQYPLRVKGTTAKVAFDKCKINGLFAGSKGLIMPNTSETDCLDYFAMLDSDLKIDVTGVNLYLIQEMDCSTLVFNNNIVYFSGSVPETEVGAGHLANFRVFNGGTLSSNPTPPASPIKRKTIDELTLSSNTFIDVESSSGSGVTGLIYCETAKKLTINNNIYWLSFPATEFGKPSPSTATVMLRLNTVSSEISSANNYGYSGNTAMNIKMYYAGTLPTGLNELEKVDGLFNTSDPAAFNKSTGVFIPKAGYTQYGAQR